MLTKLDYSSLLIFSIFTLLVGFGFISSINLYHLFTESLVSFHFLSSTCELEFSSLEVKYDIFRYRDEGTWPWLSTLLKTGFDTEVCSSLNLS